MAVSTIAGKGDVAESVRRKGSATYDVDKDNTRRISKTYNTLKGEVKHRAVQERGKTNDMVNARRGQHCDADKRN